MPEERWTAGKRDRRVGGVEWIGGGDDGSIWVGVGKSDAVWGIVERRERAGGLERSGGVRGGGGWPILRSSSGRELVRRRAGCCELEMNNDLIFSFYSTFFFLLFVYYTLPLLLD